MRSLLKKNIATRKGVMTTHREIAYKEYKQLSLPISEDISDRSIILPLYVQMKKKEIDLIIREVKLFVT
ncbi:MAG: DegT/DnrJ/EryC1/StrS aminotransferase [uncultured bacterium]|nr:MAG: DegT/DnrJ/EryC1/StrS aminotransferase [uncultured bacterium]